MSANPTGNRPPPVRTDRVEFDAPSLTTPNTLTPGMAATLSAALAEGFPALCDGEGRPPALLGHSNGSMVVGELILQGRLMLTSHHLLFQSTLKGRVTTTIALTDIVSAKAEVGSDGIPQLHVDAGEKVRAVYSHIASLPKFSALLEERMAELGTNTTPDVSPTAAMTPSTNARAQAALAAERRMAALASGSGGDSETVPTTTTTSNTPTTTTDNNANTEAETEGVAPISPSPVSPDTATAQSLVDVSESGATANATVGASVETRGCVAVSTTEGESGCVEGDGGGLSEADAAAVRAAEEELSARMAADMAASMALEQQLADEELARMMADGVSPESIPRGVVRDFVDVNINSGRGARAEDDGSWPKVLGCFSSVVADMPDLESGDKVCLPVSFLEQVVDNPRVSYPYAFELYNLDHGSRVTHVGVLSFTAPPGVVYAPYWVMRNLGLDEGSNVCVDLSKLPKSDSAFVQLQPVEAAWVDVPWEQREGALLTNLQRFQSLSVGDCMPIRHGTRDYSFKVLECRVNDTSVPAISIVDVALTTDVVEPLEEITYTAANIKVDETIDSEVAAGEYAYFCLNLKSRYGVRVLVVGKDSADPDVYASNVIKEPTREYFTWSDTTEGTVELVILGSDPHYNTGLFYVGVHSINDTAEFSLTVTELDCDESKALEEHLLASEDATVGVGGVGGSGEAGVAPQGSTLCPHCGIAVRDAAFMMHEIQCARHTFTCEECGEVMPQSKSAKHMEVVHRKFSCACGKEFTQDELQDHRENECPLRLTPCTFCKVHVTATELFEHEEACGSRTINCSRCGELVVRKKLARHLAVEHMVNPSIVDMDKEYQSIAGETMVMSNEEVAALLRAETRGGGGGGGGGSDTFLCPLCQTTFNTFEDLNIHVLTVCTDAIPMFE